jgi:hypothetical protein
MIEQFEAEFCTQLGIPAASLRLWTDLIPVAMIRRHPLRGKREPLYSGSEADFQRWTQYAKILYAGCSVAQLQELITRDRALAQSGRPAKMVEMYALLAEECYGGLTPHMLRTLCVVILYQNRLNKMLLARELARIAGMSHEQALRHLVYLQYAGALRFHTRQPRWEFSFTPQALSHYYPK